MKKKRNITNRLYGANGGWAAIRSMNYDGIAKVYDVEYHQISPIVAYYEWDQIINWCVEIFGPSGTEHSPGVWSPNQRWYANNSKILIRDETDRDWFMLKWR